MRPVSVWDPRHAVDWSRIFNERLLSQCIVVHSDNYSARETIAQRDYWAPTVLGGGGGAGEAGERLEGDGVHGVHAAAVDLDAGVQRHAGALEVGQLAGAPGRLRPYGQPQADKLTTAAVHTTEVPGLSWCCCITGYVQQCQQHRALVCTKGSASRQSLGRLQVCCGLAGGLAPGAWCGAAPVRGR